VRRPNGFTLIELMLVLIIVGVLAALAVPKYMAWARESKEAEAAPLLKQVYTLEQRYQAREGAYTHDIVALEGGPFLPTAGKYYDLSVVSHASGFCAVATPNALGTDAGLEPRSMDAQANLYVSASC